MKNASLSLSLLPLILAGCSAAQSEPLDQELTQSVSTPAIATQADNRDLDYFRAHPGEIDLVTANCEDGKVIGPACGHAREALAESLAAES